MKGSLFYIGVLCISTIMSTSYAAGQIEVDSITLLGLKYIGKNEILRQAIHNKGNKFIVDVVGLHKALQTHPLIDSYSFDIKKNVLTIAIKEKVILAVVLVDTGNSLISVEVDDKFSILSHGRIYAYDRPIIKIRRQDVINHELSPRIMNILTILKNMIRSHKTIVDKISTIDCMHPEITYVHLNGLPCKCLWDETEEALELLEAVVGVYNNSSAYPKNAIVTQKRMVVW